MTPARTLSTFLLCAALMACGNATPEPAPAPPAEPQATTLPNGPHVERFADGRKRLEGTIHEGQRHGVWTSYHGDGKVQSRNSYSNGKLHGTTVVYRESGALHHRGNFTHGVKTGEWTFYDEAGTATRTVTFDSKGERVP